MDASTRAERARQILDDELFQEAIGDVEAAAVDELATADVADNQALVRGAAALQAARALRQRFVSHVTTGKLAGRSGLAVA